MDIEKTREYYRNLKDEDICDCKWCRNFIEQIRNAYPEVAEFLDGMGVDIEKPFETWPLEPYSDGTITYLDVQYIVIGDPSSFTQTHIGDVEVHIADSHPPVEIAEQHFVIELLPFRLKWTKA